MELDDQVRNLVLIGATGSGKSTTGNFIFGGKLDEPFVVGVEEISCTFFADQHTNKNKRVRIVDTPGFGDNRFHEKEVDKIIRDLTLMLTDPTVESSGVIDAFILPVKFNPRPQTLKTDLEHFMDLFGTVAMKTLIILPIFQDDKPRNESDVQEAFRKMSEIMKMLRQGKGTEPNENWFCLWDNLKPKPRQEENLFRKISTLEPYTHKKFIEAAQEIKKRLDAKVQEEVERHVARAKKDFADDKVKLEAKLREIEAQAKQERAQLLEAQSRAQNETAKFVDALERMGESNKAQMAELYRQMAAERERANAEARKLAQDMNEQNQKQIAALMKTHADQMAQVQRSIIATANAQQPKKSGCFISSTQILLRNKKTIAIENVKPGDEVMTKDKGTAIQSEELVKWKFPEDTLIFGLNDEEPFFSAGHLFWTTEGWKAIEPEIAQLENPERKIAGKLVVGDTAFRVKEDEQDSIYDLIKIEKITQRKLGEDNYLYGLHLLDGHRSYHANGFLVAMNYPMLTYSRFKQGLDKLSADDRKRLIGLLDEASPLLDIVLGPFLSQVLDSIEK